MILLKNTYITYIKDYWRLIQYKMLRDAENYLVNYIIWDKA